MSLLKVDLPEMAKGDWRVEKFTVDCQDWGSLLRGRAVPLGETYTRLMRKSHLVMSDTPAELRDCREAIWRATGSCLVNGLGLGAVLKNMLVKPEVTDILCVEISQDLIDLISPHYPDPRLTFVCADALTFKPPKSKRFQAVWHDIWDDICADNLESMHTLHRKYGRCADWQGSWCRDECERQNGRW